MSEYSHVRLLIAGLLLCWTVESSDLSHGPQWFERKERDSKTLHSVYASLASVEFNRHNVFRGQRVRSHQIIHGGQNLFFIEATNMDINSSKNGNTTGRPTAGQRPASRSSCVTPWCHSGSSAQWRTAGSGGSCPRMLSSSPASSTSTSVAWARQGWRWVHSFTYRKWAYEFFLL